MAAQLSFSGELFCGMLWTIASCQAASGAVADGPCAVMCQAGFPYSSINETEEGGQTALAGRRCASSMACSSTCSMAVAVRRRLQYLSLDPRSAVSSRPGLRQQITARLWQTWQGLGCSLCEPKHMCSIQRSCRRCMHASSSSLTDQPNEQQPTPTSRLAGLAVKQIRLHAVSQNCHHLGSYFWTLEMGGGLPMQVRWAEGGVPRTWPSAASPRGPSRARSASLSRSDPLSPRPEAPVARGRGALQCAGHIA